MHRDLIGERGWLSAEDDRAGMALAQLSPVRSRLSRRRSQRSRIAVRVRRVPEAVIVPVAALVGLALRA